MRIVIIILILFACTIQIADANNLDSLKIFERIEKENIKTKYLNDIINKDAQIDISKLTKSKIEGLSISGKAILKSDSSFVRIVLIGSNNEEYLVYETSIVFDNIGIVNFYNSVDETFIINEMTPNTLEIQIIDAELEIKKISCYNIKEKDKLKKNEDKFKIKKEIEEQKLVLIKNYIKKEKLYWSPANNSFSSMPYKYKRLTFGKKNNTYGFEYYNDGFFSIPSSLTTSQPTLKSSSTFVDNFDWRNRHGKNWVTPNKCQSGCFLNNEINCNYWSQTWNDDSVRCVNDGGDYRTVGTCWAFSAVGTVEAATNLYFNQLINYDLSEQQVVSCAHGTAEAWSLRYTLDYIRDNYVVNESCYPYFAADGDCDDVCENPEDRISFSSWTYLNNPFHLPDFKSNLISNGPLATDLYGWGHVLVCVGWGTVSVGDYIDFGANGTIQQGDSVIGSTYWILKQSNTQTGWPNHPGYIYMIDAPSFGYRINFPITSEVYDESDIMCTDNDNDGYYFWGLGERPADCSNCCSCEPDGDDSDPTIGPIDAYGNPTIISSHCITEISTTETWTSTKNGCSEIVVKNGGSLIVTGATINLSNNATLYTEIGGELLINEGTINTN